MVEFAKRLQSIPPYLFGEVAKLKAQALEKWGDIIDFGIGDPDQPTPSPIIEELAKAAMDPTTHRYDETDYGLPEFINAVAGWYGRRFGVGLESDKGEVLLLIGSKEGLAHLAWAFIDPGDIGLVPDPGYTVYKINIALAGGVPYTMPLLAENGFLPDFSAIPSDIARKAKLLYINYPNNPTSATATLEFFADVVAFAKSYDIIVCHDAAYSEVTYDGYRAPSFLQAPGAKNVGIEIHSLSKTYNMTGWRIGWAVGNPDIIKGLSKLKSYVDSKQFEAIDRAAAYALNHLNGVPDTLVLYKKRRDILIDGLNSLGWSLPKTKATLYVWVPVPPGYTSVEFRNTLIEKAGVLVVPGIGYGEYGEGFVRFSLTVSGDSDGELVAEAIERIRKNITIRW
ncbi:MAG: LL-diaminopimelate aminotransferase [Armatimonadetes bacterium]|nr:LL-diaminopimelate aminotransferase [Armatimonadota bacterium]